MDRAVTDGRRCSVPGTLEKLLTVRRLVVRPRLLGMDPWPVDNLQISRRNPKYSH